MTEPSQIAVSSSTHDISATPKKSEADIRADRQMRLVAFYVAMATMAIIGVGAAFLASVASDGAASEETREWSRGILSAIVGGVIGVAFAKK